MKKVYHLHLIATNKITDTLFGSIPDKRDDMEAGWMHCAENYADLADSCHKIIHVSSLGGKDVIRLITQYSSNKSDAASSNIRNLLC